MEEDYLHISMVLPLDYKIVHIAFPGGNNFTTKACVYVLPVFNKWEKSNFQCKIAIFYILNATGHCLLLLFIIHICVFPSNNSFSLLKKDCYLTSLSGQYASWTSAKFCLFWMLKKVNQTSYMFNPSHVVSMIHNLSSLGTWSIWEYSGIILFWSFLHVFVKFLEWLCGFWGASIVGFAVQWGVLLRLSL